jgi:hypothetical protein
MNSLRGFDVATQHNHHDTTTMSVFRHYNAEDPALPSRFTISCNDTELKGSLEEG